MKSDNSSVDADRKKVLLVDDSDLAARVLGAALTEAGFTVERAVNGVEGIEKAYREIPDVIIMDVEMPLLQGYQASRLLKHRRGVCDIPVIMHTSLSEDKDKYWAFDSGADAFVNKDFDNLDRILETARRFADHPPFNADVIREDARKVNADFIFEIIGAVFDQQLFRATLINLLGEAGRRLGPVSETASGVLDVLSRVCASHLSVIMLKTGRRARAYIRPEKEIFAEDVDDFHAICQNDFFRRFPDLNMEACEKTMFNTQERDDFHKLRPDRRRLSSYACFELIGKGGCVIGTLHAGHLTNNYFSPLIMENLRVFSESCAAILENSVLFNQISEMENNIRRVFSKFVPAEIIDDLVEKHADAGMVVGEKRKIAILFSDIRAFTSISENNAAEDIVSFLNNYFDIMVNIIKTRGGTVDKFIGDAILAIFGAPKSYEDNAGRAVAAAVEMIRALPSADVGALTLPAEGLRIGIGVHEGVAVVGNIGSSDKLEYTVIGDAVNLASRLEGLTKHYSKPIIVSEEVKEQVGDAFLLRQADVVKVKGKDRPTAVYAVETDPAPFDQRFMENYVKGIKLFKLGAWDTAAAYFDAALQRLPDDALTRRYIGRCREYMEHPPEAWDGAVALDFK